MKSAKYLFIDGDSDIGAGSVYVPDTVDMAALATFVGVVNGGSDAVQYKRELTEDVELAYTLPDPGLNEVERRGTIVLRQISTKQNFKVGIPAISNAMVDKQGKASPKVLDSFAESVRAAFVTMTGITDADVKVLRSYVTETP
jgi:hypothetical protein